MAKYKQHYYNIVFLGWRQKKATPAKYNLATVTWVYKRKSKQQFLKNWVALPLMYKLMHLFSCIWKHKYIVKYKQLPFTK